MKAFIRIFISLCLLLLSGQGYAHAQQQKQYTACSSPQACQKTVKLSVDAVKYRCLLNSSHQIYKPAPVASRKRTNKVCTTDNDDEDDEAGSFKNNNTGNSLFVITRNFESLPGLLHIHTPKCLPLLKHFSLRSLQRIIILRSIRI